MPLYDAPGSPPGKLSTFDWKSILWTLATAAVAAVLTAVVDSVLPDLKEKGWIDAALFTALTTGLHALRKYLTDTRVLVVLLAGLLLTFGGTATAAEPVVITPPPGLADGNHHVTLTVKGGELVAIRPLKSLTWGAGPPPTDPGNPTAFEAEVERRAKAALAAGGTLTTGAAFCEAYFIVGAGVADGTIDHARSLEAVNLATRHILANTADRAKWTGFELFVRNELQVLDSKGALKTKADYALVLKSVASGLTKATGYKPAGKSLLLAFDKAKATLTLADMAAMRKSFGIFDEIDFGKLIEFIRFIIELFKLFAP